MADIKGGGRLQTRDGLAEEIKALHAAAGGWKAGMPQMIEIDDYNRSDVRVYVSDELCSRWDTAENADALVAEWNAALG